MAKYFLSHLAHVELITPKLDESVAFFTDALGTIKQTLLVAAQLC